MDKNTINRYTSLASAVNLLAEKKLTLLDPSSWDDKNDVHYLDQYKKITGTKSLFALCLSRSNPTYHHWRVFAGSPDGVCISFYEDKLKSAILGDSRIEYEDVEYLSMPEARKRAPFKSNELKFVKHSRYRDEKETRIVFADTVDDISFPSFPLGVDAVERITLSPWLPKPLGDSMKNLIKSIEGCEKLKVYRSTLTDFKGWKDLAKNCT